LNPIFIIIIFVETKLIFYSSSVQNYFLIYNLKINLFVFTKLKLIFSRYEKKKKDSDVNLDEITRHRLHHHHLRHSHLLLPSFVAVVVVVQEFVVVVGPTFDVVVVVVAVVTT